MIEHWDKENDLAVAGAVDDGDFDFIVSNFRGVLYIATEYEGGDGDSGFPFKPSSTMKITEVPFNFYDSLWHQKDTHFHRGLSIEKYYQLSYLYLLICTYHILLRYI